MTKPLCLFLILLLAGCASRPPFGSFDGLGHEHDADARVLAQRTVKILEREYAPGQTPIALARVPGAYGDDLENGLRAKGFALTAQGENALDVRYLVDFTNAEKETGFVQVIYGDGRVFTFEQKLGAAPLAPLRFSATPPAPEKK